ncbi:MAG: PilZ domain-containing protein [Butyrivibrio sp.]|nr:PilZ domain-containing protein [Butyrivibrio sp.]
MHMNEIPEESLMYVTLSMLGVKQIFKTKAITAFEGGMLVEPLMFAGVPLNHIDKAEVRVESSIDGSVKYLHADSIDAIRNWGGVYHVIKGSEVQNDASMRKSERVKVEKIGKVYINCSSLYSSVIVQDISMQGISFMMGPKVKCNVGDRVRIVFEPKDDKKKIEVIAKVVRLFDVSSLKGAGCKITEMNPALIDYLLELKSYLVDDQKESQKEVTKKKGAFAI